MATARKYTILFLSVLIAITIVTAVITFSLYYPQTFTIPIPTPPKQPEIKIFWDAQRTQEVVNGTAWNWGEVSYGSNYKTIYVKNVGNCNITIYMMLNNLPSGVQCGWNWLSETTIAIGEVVSIHVTLDIPETLTSGTYTFDMWIVAEGVS